MLERREGSELQAIARLQRALRVLVAAWRDPRTPWYARVAIACVLAYALSPLDLIPDAIPVVGHLDDLVIVPLGLFLAFRLIPPEVRADAARAAADPAPVVWRRYGTALVFSLWALLVALVIGGLVVLLRG